MNRLADLGTVERGKLADLVLLDANPLDDIANTKRIRAVVLAGRYLDRIELDRMLKGVEKAAAEAGGAPAAHGSAQ
jgi:cytosine/adenosine deaminase-related metal-dependent hydrolase